MKSPEAGHTPEQKMEVKVEDLVSETIERPYEWEEGKTEELRYINVEDLLNAIQKNEISSEEIYDNLLNYRHKGRTLDEWLVRAKRYLEDLQTSEEVTENKIRLAERDVKKYEAMKRANRDYIPIRDNTNFEIISKDSKKLQEVFADWLAEKQAHVASGEYDEMNAEQIAKRLSQVTDDPIGRDPGNINVSLDYPELIHNVRLHDWIAEDPDKKEFYAKMIFTEHTRDLDGKLGCAADLVSMLKLATYFKEKGVTVDFYPMWSHLNEGDDRVILYRVR